MSAKAILAQHEKSMEKTIEVMKNELRQIRTGRASPGLVENLMVDYYGTRLRSSSLPRLPVRSRRCWSSSPSISAA
jgi:ribosome recycling factor